MCCASAVQDNHVKVQTGLMSDQLREALQNVQGFKLLDFTTMNGAMKNFTSTGACTFFAAAPLLACARTSLK
jgi:hypothetical protein